MQTRSKWSSKDSKVKEWQKVAFILFMPLSIAITILGSLILSLGNLLMFDTHHLEISIKPKK